MLKRDEKRECCSDMGRKETLREAASQAVMVIERIALDANLVFYDIAMDVKEMLVGDAKKAEEYIKMVRTSGFLTKYPRVAALAYSVMVLK